jgi:protein-S-isoprenylcysteine O-methyltransferase Ste14
MLDLMRRIANQSANPLLFIDGMSIIYLTGVILLIAAALKFLEHSANPQRLVKNRTHPFSTREMTACVLMLFPFWFNSIGQIKMNSALQYVYFGIGVALIIWAIAWHVWAKINIRAMWSDGIEIKEYHQLITTGAFALARHPMYGSLLLWCWSASLMMFNWITLALTSLVILPLMIVRARTEEQELIRVQPDYRLYQENARMLTPTLSGLYAVAFKVIAIILLGYYIWQNVTLPSLLLLFSVHLYLGVSLTPEKVAFSYRSKSGMLLVFWGLSLLWHPFYYLLYVVLAMFIYGMKFNCPCMIVYNKYHRCPCFDLAANCFLKKHAAK